MKYHFGDIVEVTPGRYSVFPRFLGVIMYTKKGIHGTLYGVKNLPGDGKTWEMYDDEFSHCYK